ncbi:hypothetical protein [Nocardia tengchongensis]|uniref:hypothetical protein n=1 Tax=Nocardia tengchongensis TaxID=2055889 RepID=UPI003660F6A8
MLLIVAIEIAIVIYLLGAAIMYVVARRTRPLAPVSTAEFRVMVWAWPIVGVMTLRKIMARKRRTKELAIKTAQLLWALDKDATDEAIVKAFGAPTDAKFNAQVRDALRTIKELKAAGW